jgi:hypothetical protein
MDQVAAHFSYFGPLFPHEHNASDQQSCSQHPQAGTGYTTGIKSSVITYSKQEGTIFDSFHTTHDNLFRNNAILVC